MAYIYWYRNPRIEFYYVKIFCNKSFEGRRRQYRHSSRWCRNSIQCCSPVGLGQPWLGLWVGLSWHGQVWERNERDPAPLPTPRRPGPFITQPLLTVTDGSDPGLASHQRQNHTAHEPTDSWSAVSSGGETVAINNPRHMMQVTHGRQRGHRSDGAPGREMSRWVEVTVMEAFSLIKWAEMG